MKKLIVGLLFLFIWNLNYSQTDIQKSDIKRFLKDHKYLTNDKTEIFILRNNICGALCGERLGNFLLVECKNDSTPKLFLLAQDDSILVRIISRDLYNSKIEFYDANSLGEYNMYGTSHIYIAISRKRFQFNCF